MPICLAPLPVEQTRGSLLVQADSKVISRLDLLTADKQIKPITFSGFLQTITRLV